MTLCFDTGPLSAFAQAGRFSVLERLCQPHEALITAAVRDELRKGAASHPALQAVLDAGWLQVVSCDDLETLRAILIFTEALGAGERHLGECTVLAWSQRFGAMALLDDADARVVGRREGVTVKGTLALVAEGIQTAVLDEASACVLIDDLVATGYRLPCDGASFPSWARQHKLL